MQPSDDPIFPARADAGAIFYYNVLRRSTVLGCIDSAEFCSADKRFCWNIDNDDDMAALTQEYEMNPPRQTVEGVLALQLLCVSIARSNVVQAALVAWSGNLDARSKLYNQFSGSLQKEQWKEEVRKLFKTSLARLQGEVFDIARGTHSQTPFARNVMPDSFRGMCNIVKFPTDGWTNISLIWLIAIPLLVTVLWISTVQFGNKILLVLFWCSVVFPVLCWVKEHLLVPLWDSAVVPAYNWINGRLWSIRQEIEAFVSPKLLKIRQVMLGRET